MSSASFRTVQRKIAPTFGGFTPAWGGEIFTGLFFVYAAQFLHTDNSPIRFRISHASLSLYRAKTFDKIMYIPITDMRY